MNTKICAIVRTSEGIRICEVTNYPIYDHQHLLPMMEVKAIDGKRLNSINRIVVPMAGVFTAVSAPEIQS